MAIISRKTRKHNSYHYSSYSTRVSTVNNGPSLSISNQFFNIRLKKGFFFSELGIEIDLVRLKFS